MKLQRDVGRSCGECNACCKMFVVPEVGKHNGDWCSKCIRGKGCSIYAERPLACKLYACAWLNGSGNANFRPDRLGVMIDMKDVRIHERLVGELHFWEMRKGALQQPVIHEMAEANKDAGFVVVYHRISTSNTYRKQVGMRKRHFTEEEVDFLLDEGP